MTTLVWDQIGQRLYETGVDRGVLYLPDVGGAYSTGAAWNGLISVTESPTGAEPTALWADNIKYLNLYSAEEFAASIEAYTFPDEFLAYDGVATPSAGVGIGQQPRKPFGMSYRTKLGNDVSADAYGYKLHLIYGCTASPSEKSYNTINDSPEALALTWEVSTVPVNVTGYAPTSQLTVDSTKVDPTALSQLQDFLWGTPGSDPMLPLPDDVLALFAGTATEVTPTEPSFNGTSTITIPSVTGVTYYVLGLPVAAGALIITEDTIVSARPNAGYVFPPAVDTDWGYVYA